MHTPFVIEQIYDAPIEKAWKALTDKNQMKEWYFPQLLGFEPVVGFKFEFAKDGSSYEKEWIVTRVVDGRILAHTWKYKNYPGMSEVTFQLSNEAHNTRLRLTHTGLETFPDDPHFARHRFEDGWTRIIGSDLKRFLEKDVDERK